jgi:fatty acid-binding protein DegV
VDDLIHLKRGGRLSGFEAAVGTALKIKPVLSIDREGKLIARFEPTADMKDVKAAIEELL